LSKIVDFWGPGWGPTFCPWGPKMALSTVYTAQNYHTEQAFFQGVQNLGFFGLFWRFLGFLRFQDFIDFIDYQIILITDSLSVSIKLYRFIKLKVQIRKLLKRITKFSGLWSWLWRGSEKLRIEGCRRRALDLTSLLRSPCCAATTVLGQTAS